MAVGLGLTVLSSAGEITPTDRADLDGSRMVDAVDLQMVAADLGNEVPPADPRADLDSSGEVNGMDLSVVAAQLGRQVPGQIVVLTDSNLEAVVREQLGKPQGDLTPQDLGRLKILGATGREIADLTGLEHATNLEHLSLQINQISDLSPLSGLTNLDNLGLWNNDVRDLSPLLA